MTRTLSINKLALQAGRIVALAAPFALAACMDSQPANEQTTVQSTLHVCSSCHGAEGRSVNPTFPILAGQQPAYLEAQLKAFRDKTRADPHAHTYMWGMAAGLSDDTIAGVAKFFGSQTPAPGSDQDPALVAAGAKIFNEGIDSEQVPACIGCHGDKAQGNETIPRLAGQHREYLTRQLEAFASNARANEIMHANSTGLTHEQIDAVTAYFAAQ